MNNSHDLSFGASTTLTVERPGGMRTSLLIAFGDKHLAYRVQTFLEHQSYVVETALDGLDCLDKLRRYTPDILVVEQELPWGGGDGVLARMREQTDVPIVPVVLITAAGSEGPMPLPSLVSRCLRKPFALPMLLHSIRTIHEQV